jgi:hypothetical protein
MDEKEQPDDNEHYKEDDRYGFNRLPDDRKSFYFDFQDWNDYEDES